MIRRKKYAIVPICMKEYRLRCVLISYENKVLKSIDNVLYEGTKLIAKDPYFYDSSKSHQYDFHDTYYILSSVNNTHKIYESYLLGEKRPYHYHINSMFKNPIEFKAFTQKGALRKFRKYILKGLKGKN